MQYSKQCPTCSTGIDVTGKIGQSATCRGCGLEWRVDHDEDDGEVYIWRMPKKDAAPAHPLPPV